jgi:hypothetical protein
MAMTVTTQELFQGAGSTRNSGNPGAFASVSGTVYCFPGGARAASDTTAASRGWSGDSRANLALGTSYGFS